MRMHKLLTNSSSRLIAFRDLDDRRMCFFRDDEEASMMYKTIPSKRALTPSFPDVSNARNVA